MKRKLKYLSLGLLGLIIVLLVPLVGALVECRVWSDVDPALAEAPSRLIDTLSLSDEDRAGYYRAEDQTYLTLPEWYIVFNADEYAAHLKEKRPSSFPHFRAIGQYWRTYYGVCGEIRGKYPFNTQYQIIIGVISVSFTVESAIRGIYENTLGRLNELLSTSGFTQEEIYAQRIAEEYGTFIHTIPWFRFPFGDALRGLWQETSLWGANPLRKWERKVVLSAEYGIKAGYGWLLGAGRDASFDPIILETQAVVRGLSEELLDEYDGLRVIESLDDQTVVAGLPRYEEFTQIVPQLVAQGVAFDEIAGNDDIMITAFVPIGQLFPLEDITVGNSEILYRMPVLIAPEFDRIALKVPVEQLHTILAQLDAEGGQLEHIYDY